MKSMIRVVQSMTAVLTVLMAASASARADTNLMFILDASNSMWGQTDDVPKIDTARSVLSELLARTASDTRVGLMAYGHRSKTSCDDIQIIAPLGTDTPEQLIAALGKIQPTGMTPIAAALAAAGKTFTDESANNNVILISDGIETCHGDPCAVAGRLSSKGIRTRIHVVGFDVDAAAREQLRCIAVKGGGQYFNAENAGELKAAVAEVKEVAETPPAAADPEPQPAGKVVFKDEFDGNGLKSLWKVMNPSADSFIVEKGNLLMIAHGKGGFDSADSPNIMRLNLQVPDGDWEMTAVVQADYQTGMEGVWLGLYGDANNFIAARLYSALEGDVSFHLDILKAADGQQMRFRKKLRAGQCNWYDCAKTEFPKLAAGLKMPMTLSLVKEGRKFFARVKLQGDQDEAGNQIVYETAPVSSLRTPGGPAIAVGQNNQTDGETLFYFDQMEIDASD